MLWHPEVTLWWPRSCIASVDSGCTLNSSIPWQNPRAWKWEASVQTGWEEMGRCKSQTPTTYPLVTYKKQWKITIFHGQFHYKSPFSIAMLVYQRVTWQWKTFQFLMRQIIDQWRFSHCHVFGWQVASWISQSFWITWPWKCTSMKNGSSRVTTRLNDESRALLQVILLCLQIGLQYVCVWKFENGGSFLACLVTSVEAAFAFHRFLLFDKAAVRNLWALHIAR